MTFSFLYFLFFRAVTFFTRDGLGGVSSPHQDIV